MTVNTFSWMSAQTGATDAEWRKAVQGIHDALVAVGCVQTSDTGQLTISSGAPGSTNTWTQYEIWRFNDALQATQPLFFRLDYGTGSSTGRLAMRITIGTGSNGSGTITGTLLPVTALTSSAPNAVSTEYPSYASGDGSSVNIVLWPSYANTQHLGGFTISRSCDTDGTYTGDAFAICLYGNPPAFNVIGSAGTDGSVESAKSFYLPVTLPYTINGANTSLSSTLSEDGTTAPVLPVAAMAPGVTPFVLNCLAVVHPGDAGATSVIQVAEINGEARTYRAFPYINPQAPGNLAILSSVSSVGARCQPAIAWAV